MQPATEQPHSIFTASRDLLAICIVVALANLLLDPPDPGWLALNPTPWLLPAALMGARYGFTSGLLSGLVIAGSLAFCRSRMQGLEFNELFREHSYFFLTIVVTGAVAGEAGRLLHRRSAAALKLSARLEHENTRLRHQLHITDETRHQLQQQLVLFNAPMCALDDELATLFTYPKDEFPHQLLRVLHRLTGITSAGIYVIDGDKLAQVTVLHPTPPLVPTRSLRDTPLAEKSLSAGALASVPDATELTQAQPFLAAFPWLDHTGRTCVLLIQDMPLEAFNLQNLARLELILSWASAITVMRLNFSSRLNDGHAASHEDFLVLLSEAVEASRIHRLPSTVLRFDFESAESVPSALYLLPKTAVATRLHKKSSVVILLPFSGQTEAQQARRAIASVFPATRSQHHVISGDIATRDLWATLQKS
jgi:hypothetical protein